MTDAAEREGETGAEGRQEDGHYLSDSEFWHRTSDTLERTSASALRAAMPVWPSYARPAQLPPPGAWRQWLLIGGRGSGKTRAGAEWVRAMAAGNAPFAARPHGRIALIAETLGDAREVMIDGESGLMAVSTGPRPVFEVSRRRVVFANGAIAQIFSSEDPDALRGYQFDAAWGDEFAKWGHGEACFDNLQFGLRLGDRPRALFTTTPRPIPLLKRLIADPATVTSHMRTAENARNLAPGFLAAMETRYGGSRLGRQELEGLMIEAREDALFDLAAIERARVRAAPDYDASWWRSTRRRRRRPAPMPAASWRPAVPPTASSTSSRMPRAKGPSRTSGQELPWRFTSGWRPTASSRKSTRAGTWSRR